MPYAWAMRPLPPVYFLLGIGAMLALHRFVPVARWVAEPWNALGAILVVAGLGLSIYAASLFRKRGTGIKPFSEATALVVEGPYRFTRNPMYLGLTIALAGVAILLGTATPWLVVPPFVWIITVQYVVKEEAMLRQRFGGEYEAFTRRVRRWI